MLDPYRDHRGWAVTPLSPQCPIGTSVPMSSSPEQSGETPGAHTPSREPCRPQETKAWVPVRPGHTSPHSPDRARGSKELVPREGALRASCIEVGVSSTQKNENGTSITQVHTTHSCTHAHRCTLLGWDMGSCLAGFK